MVEPDRGSRNLGRGQGLINYHHNFGVGRDTFGTHNVKIALGEFAESALGRPFAAKHAADRKPLERHSNFVDVCCHKPCQGNGMIKPQGEFARRSTGVDHIKNLAENFLGASTFASQDLFTLNVRSFNRLKPKRAKRPAKLVNKSFSRLGQTRW